MVYPFFTKERLLTYQRTKKNLAQSYIEQLFAQEDELLKSIRQSLIEDKKEYMSVSAYEGKLLQFFIRLLGIEKIVEIGTLYGYSALWMARGLSDCGKIHCIEREEINYKKAEEFLNQSEVRSKIQLYNGEAIELLRTLEPYGPFDMVFIDANKSGYLDYLNWAEENVRIGGLIVGDNTFLFGHVFSESESRSVPDGIPKMNINQKQVQIMKEFNQKLANPQKYNSLLISTAEGLTIAQRR